ncbi:hypothetical protein SprV_0401428400 [Sparganum proliferum]
MKFLIGVLLIVSILVCPSTENGDWTECINLTVNGNQTTNDNKTVKPPSSRVFSFPPLLLSLLLLALVLLALMLLSGYVETLPAVDGDADSSLVVFVTALEPSPSAAVAVNVQILAEVTQTTLKKDATESSVIMKFLFGVVLIVSVVFCVSSDKVVDTTKNDTDVDPNGAGNNKNDSLTPVTGKNETTGNDSVTTQSASSSEGSNEGSSTSGALALSMTQFFLLPLLLAVFAKL